MSHAVLWCVLTINVSMLCHFSNFRSKRQPGNARYAVRVSVLKLWQLTSMLELFYNSLITANHPHR